jgi:pseudouridine synthase
MAVRLQKALAERGVCSRRKAEQLIAAGRVRVNGEIVTTTGVKVDPETDVISVDGKPAQRGVEFVYVIVNKPPGVVTTCADERGAPAVIELVDVPERLYPVGRLDKDSCGLVLLTNDGDLTLRLTHPRYGHAKEYVATLAAAVNNTQMARLRSGVELDDGVTLPAEVSRVGACRVCMVLREGRKRQIRRMCAAVGVKVVRLERTRIECVELGGLAPGAWRRLSAAEVKKLRACLRAEPVPRKAGGAADAA